MANACHWDPIDRFTHQNEYRQFADWMADQVKKGNAQEVPVRQKLPGEAGEGERWFQCGDCRAVWRLIPPHGSFKGMFEPV